MSAGLLEIKKSTRTFKPVDVILIYNPFLQQLIQAFKDRV